LRQERPITLAKSSADAAESLKVLLADCVHEVQFAREGFSAMNVSWTYCPYLILLEHDLPRICSLDVAQGLSDVNAFAQVKTIALMGLWR